MIKIVHAFIAMLMTATMAHSHPVGAHLHPHGAEGWVYVLVAVAIVTLAFGLAARR
jgi:hypothetical protein